MYLFIEYVFQILFYIFIKYEIYVYVLKLCSGDSKNTITVILAARKMRPKGTGLGGPSSISSPMKRQDLEDVGKAKFSLNPNCLVKLGYKRGIKAKLRGIKAKFRGIKAKYIDRYLRLIFFMEMSCSNVIFFFRVGFIHH